jgi:predicted DNA-binding protein
MAARLRIQVRLDAERRKKLDTLVARSGKSPSAVIRDAIDQLYELELPAIRMEAVNRIAAMEIEDVPEPDELKRQLNTTYDIGPLYPEEVEGWPKWP